MRNFKIAKIISITVTVVGILVMIGWIRDIAILKSIFPGLVTMKFITALSFVFSGLLLYCLILVTKSESDLAQLVLPILSLAILFVEGGLLIPVIFSVPFGIEKIFVEEQVGAIRTTIPGRPSLMTIIAFILVAISGFVTVFKIRTGIILKALGLILSMIGFVAISGYILGIPVLYYAVEKMSTAMALHTAILFILLGLGLSLIAQPVE